MHLSRRVASRFLTETEKSGTGARFLNTDNVDHQFQVQSCGTGPDVRHLTRTRLPDPLDTVSLTDRDILGQHGGVEWVGAVVRIIRGGLTLVAI